MILDYGQITNALNGLNQAKNEQLQITADAKKVVINQLSTVWESQAQRAYQETYLAIERRAFDQINKLISLFETAAAQCKEGLHKVDVDLAKMNSTTVGD